MALLLLVLTQLASAAQETTLSMAMQETTISMAIRRSTKKDDSEEAYKSISRQVPRSKGPLSDIEIIPKGSLSHRHPRILGKNKTTKKEKTKITNYSYSSSTVTVRPGVPNQSPKNGTVPNVSYQSSTVQYQSEAKFYGDLKTQGNSVVKKQTTTQFLSPLNSPALTTTSKPSNIPTSDPTKDPSSSPTSHPTKHPSTSPSNHPTKDPSTSPSSHPTKHPSTSPSSHPTKDPSSSPSNFPTKDPSSSPSSFPTKDPSYSPSGRPTNYPSQIPTSDPSERPSTHTTEDVITALFGNSTPDDLKNTTRTPSTHPPADVITALAVSSTPHTLINPTKKPTWPPTVSPSNDPTSVPSTNPTENPIVSTTVRPSKSPTHLPTRIPVEQTLLATSSPTKKHNPSPSKIPSQKPTLSPTDFPTKKPSPSPTKNPTVNPTSKPTRTPSNTPTFSPTNSTTNHPSVLNIAIDMMSFQEPLTATNPTQSPVKTPSFKVDDAGLIVLEIPGEENNIPDLSLFSRTEDPHLTSRAANIKTIEILDLVAFEEADVARQSNGMGDSTNEGDQTVNADATKPAEKDLKKATKFLSNSQLGLLCDTEAEEEIVEFPAVEISLQIQPGYSPNEDELRRIIEKSLSRILSEESNPDQCFDSLVVEFSLLESAQNKTDPIHLRRLQEEAGSVVATMGGRATYRGDAPSGLVIQDYVRFALDDANENFPPKLKGSTYTINSEADNVDDNSASYYNISNIPLDRDNQVQPVISALDEPSFSNSRIIPTLLIAGSLGGLIMVLACFALTRKHMKKSNEESSINYKKSNTRKKKQIEIVQSLESRSTCSEDIEEAALKAKGYRSFGDNDDASYTGDDPFGFHNENGKVSWSQGETCADDKYSAENYETDSLAYTASVMGLKSVGTESLAAPEAYEASYNKSSAGGDIEVKVTHTSGAVNREFNVGALTDRHHVLNMSYSYGAETHYTDSSSQFFPDDYDVTQYRIQRLKEPDPSTLQRLSEALGTNRRNPYKENSSATTEHKEVNMTTSTSTSPISPPNQVFTKRSSRNQKIMDRLKQRRSGLNMTSASNEDAPSSTSTDAEERKRRPSIKFRNYDSIIEDPRRGNRSFQSDVDESDQMDADKYVKYRQNRNQHH